MIKYLNSRKCPKCRSSVIIMLLRYSEKIRTITGICDRCDYAMKWQLIYGNGSMGANLNVRNSQTNAAPGLKDGQAAN
jgi:hypothetical protein